MSKQSEKPHHHGNLREALVTAGFELLEEGGLAALTLRKCAARAGVSHAAPAHHFDGLAGLKTAIAARGYAVFEQMMKDGIAAAGPEPKAQAYGLCLGYLGFATEHNALFNLIFDRPDKFTGDPEWRQAAQTARQVLNDVSAKFETGSGGEPATEVAIFALVHGYAKLIEIGRVVPGSDDARDVKFREVFDMLNLEVKPEA